MRTRRGLCYPRVMDTCGSAKRRKLKLAGDEFGCQKRLKTSPEENTGGCDFFDALPDDLALYVLCKLSSTAGCPADFINVMMTYGFFFLLGVVVLLNQIKFIYQNKTLFLFMTKIYLSGWLIFKLHFRMREFEDCLIKKAQRMDCRINGNSI